MKRIFILVFGMVLSLGVNAQLKEIQLKDGMKAVEHGIVPPASKTNLSSSIHSREKYTPKSLSFVRAEENGLRVVSRGKDTQLPIFIKGNPEKLLKQGNSMESKAFNFLENAKGLMKINNPSQEFRVVKIDTDDLGMTHVKLQQVIHGIPVYGSEVIYHTTKDASILNGRYTSTPSLDSYVPSIEKQNAEEIAVTDIGGITPLIEDKFDLFDFERINAELVIFEGKLAYHFSIYKNIVDLWEYFVDAQTGEIIDRYTNICKFHNHTSGKSCTHNVSKQEAVLPNGPILSSAVDLFGITRNINTYEVNGTFYMIDAARTMFNSDLSEIPDDPVGTIWTIDAFDTSPENSNFSYDHVTSGVLSFSGKPTGVSAQYNGGQAYLYFKNIHGRESIDSSGGNIISLINISDQDGSSLGNAFWNGIAMFYGNGDSSFESLARGLDVAGHEMSHGVIQNSANLEYRGESGALNESFADVFGAMIDREDWLIGEDVVKSGAFPSGALRSLQDPHNGASTGNFNQGWQPKVYSERFTGSQDNGGVHINSGIPNYAFFLFASNSDVGKQRAEQVYYRALDKYLTKSSQFIDARLAVVQAATDLYGSQVANRAKEAFDQVEVFNGNGTNTQTDVEVNPGEDLILFTTENQDALYIADAAGNLIFNPLTEENPISVPSITDDGSEIIFVNDSKELYYIRIDWSSSTPSIAEQGVIGSNDAYRNAVFSKDGLRLAALRDVEDNEIFVYDFVTSSGINYELFNPTYTEGVNTGDVLYADALEFDFTGEYVLYDAFNQIESSFGNDISYWDIGFIKVFDNDAQTFTFGNDIQKLFTQLPEGVSIGNPTFSKNSDYIVAFDFVENDFSVLGANIETGTVGTIFSESDRPGYPNYSNNDEMVIYDAADSNNKAVIAGSNMKENKIESLDATVFLGFAETGVKWGVWFGNGDRVLADVEDVLADDSFDIFPNPASQQLTISTKNNGPALTAFRITDMMGRTVFNDSPYMNGSWTIDISSFPVGQYILTMSTKEGRSSKMFIKE
ncbi:MAG: M4 family metallopeptidase [Saprospiraceae bacterium]|nr:M4 family metallopeptidase [Saprospiraceae bacterium]